MTDKIEDIDFEHADLERVTELLEILTARDDDHDGGGDDFSEPELAEARARILSTVLRTPISQQPAEVPTEHRRDEPADHTPGRSATASQRRAAFHDRRRLSRVKRLCSRAERLDLALTSIEVASSARLGPTSASARTQLAKLTDTVQQQISDGEGRRLRKVSYVSAILTCGLLIADFVILGVALNAIFAPTSPAWGLVSSFALALLIVGVQTRLGVTVGERFRNSAIGRSSAGILAILSLLSGGAVYNHYATNSATVFAAALAAACVMTAPWLVALLEQSATAIELQEMERLRGALCRRDSRVLRAYRVALRDLRSAHRVINVTERRQVRRPSDHYSEVLQEMYATLMSADERARYTLWRFSRPHLLPLESLSQTRGPADDVNVGPRSEHQVSDEEWRNFEREFTKREDH